MDLINYNGMTPQSAYDGRTHLSGAGKTTITDFKYSIPVYYGDMPLVDKSGNPLNVTAYIGVKGDISLNNIVDSVDASTTLKYYAQVQTNDNTPNTVKCQTTSSGLEVSSPTDELDQLAAFLADVTENEWSEDNWKKKKDERVLDAVDASNILAFYSKRQTSNYDGISDSEIWNEVLGEKRFGN